MGKVKTHDKADPRLLGKLVILEKGKAVVELTATVEMVVDDRGLVHGGFTFGLADYAAMLVINDPHVVLGSADVKFTAPVKAGIGWWPLA
jgi:acyl-coenzyme A thioesterase PaaI-like protein